MMFSISSDQTSGNVRRVMMKMMVVRLMAADIKEVRMTILLSGRHWPLLTLHLIFVFYVSSLLFWITNDNTIAILDNIVVVVLVRVLHGYV